MSSTKTTFFIHIAASVQQPIFPCSPFRRSKLHPYRKNGRDHLVDLGFFG